MKKYYSFFGYSRILTAVIITSVFCLSFTCEKRSDSPVISRVGSAELRLDDLYSRIPPEYSNKISREQMINYVKQWMDTELLYQEALRLNIQKEKKIREKLAKMRKDLLSAEVISRNALTATKYRISDEAIQNYYNKNKSTFLRESDMVKCMEIVVDNLKTAWQVRNMVTANNFLDLAVKYSKAPVQDPRTVPYVPVEELPKPIGKIVSGIRVNGTTSPIKTNDGYHIIRVLDKKKAGEICDIDEVKDDIINILSSKAQKLNLENLLSNLRLKTDYEFHFDKIPNKNAITEE